jgi:CCR4-NOT transcription complex subunit 3
MRPQEEDFEEDEAIYDELRLDEEEEKFGLAFDDNNDTDESDLVSEGDRNLLPRLDSSNSSPWADLPTRAPKKHDEESIASSKRDESPVLKKAAVTIQLRSMLLLSIS